MKLDVGVQKVAAAARRQTTVKWGFIVGCFALLLGSAVLFSILLQGGSGRATYDFRTHTIFQDEADYAYLQENIDSLLQQLGQPPEGGVQIAERKSDENAQKANLVLERGVKVFHIQSDQLQFGLRHGGLAQEVVHSEYYTWYFPVYSNSEEYQLIFLNHSIGVPELSLPGSFELSEEPLAFNSEDGFGGFAFHPELVQELLQQAGVQQVDTLVPLNVTVLLPYTMYSRIFFQVVYAENEHGRWVIPYNFRDQMTVPIENLKLYTAAEFSAFLDSMVSGE